MLGQKVSDPEQVEEGGAIRGMGLLPVETILTREKIRTQVHGHFSNLSGILKSLSGMEMAGYEIHMGKTEIFPEKETSVMAEITVQTLPGQKPEPDGCCQENVYGTYIHGIFDEAGIVKSLLTVLAEKKGVALDYYREKSWREYKEAQYDLLADTLRRHVNMEAVYTMMKEGVRK